MNNRDELLHRITKANPVPSDAELPGDVVDSRPPLALLINEGGSPSAAARPQRSARTERRWRDPLVAAGTAAILIVGAASLMLLLTGEGEVTDPPIDPTPTTMESAPTTVPPPTTVVVSPESWDPILATTTAGVAAPAAECPAGSNPEVPGQVDQPRPEPRWIRNLAGAFDQAAGRIVFVDVTGATWLFDVCTNTWHQPDPDGTPVPPDELYDAGGEPSGVLGQLVYDVDSDVTIALSWERVSVYDANTNTWDQRAIEIDGVGPLGAVYDPVSGLVITSTGDGDEWDLWAYDVDTNEWTMLGPVTIDRDTPCCTQIDLLGYSDDLDRLILTTNIGEATYTGEAGATLLVDPRTGEMVINPATEAPVVDLGWPSHAYGTGLGTVHVYMQQKPSVCWFDAETRTWPCRTRPPDMPERYYAFSAMVGDPINNRLLFINGVYGGWWKNATNDIWAVDLDTGEWNQILAPSTSEDLSGDLFTFAEDDLCEWVSEDEVTSFVRAAYDKLGFEWDGRADAVPHQGSAWDLSGAYCRWEPTGGGHVIARGLTPSAFGGGTVEFSEVDDELLFPLSGPVSGHPRFADDIIVANAAFGRLGFWVQDSDEALGLEMHLPFGIPEDDWASQEQMWSDVANSFLNQMGWTS